MATGKHSQLDSVDTTAACLHQFSKEHFFLKGLSDLEKALDELVEANRRSKKRSTLPTVSLKSTFSSEPETLKCGSSSDLTYLRLHEVRLQVNSCKSKLEALLSPASHNGVAARTSVPEECCDRKRCESADKSQTNKRPASTTATSTSANHSRSVSLACCAIPIRRKTRRDAARSPFNAPLAVEPQKLHENTVWTMACLTTYDSVIANFLKLSEDDLTEKTALFLRSIKFDNFMWTDQQLMLMIKWMYRDLQLLQEFSIDIQVFNSWLCAIYRHYNPVPYHNFNHAFMVFQMVYALLSQLRLTRFYSKLEQLALLTAALVHDLDHPGLNNSFHINAKTSLALLYNDLSPLENHHCATAFQILSLPHCNILNRLNNEQYKEFRCSLVRCVLATDMAKHFEISRNVEHELFDAQNKQCILDWNLKEHRRQMDVLLIKWADISNEVRPLEVASKWADCLLSEFFRQGDLEKELGLPVSPLMDRQKATRIAAQVSFIEHVLNPLSEVMVRVFPQLDNDLLLCLRGKIVYYKSLENFEPPTGQTEIKPAT